MHCVYRNDISVLLKLLFKLRGYKQDNMHCIYKVMEFQSSSTLTKLYDTPVVSRDSLPSGFPTVHDLSI